MNQDEVSELIKRLRECGHLDVVTKNGEVLSIRVDPVPQARKAVGPVPIDHTEKASETTLPRSMMISTLIERLLAILRERGDLQVTGVCMPLAELAVHDVRYVHAGSLKTTCFSARKDILPDRVQIEWKVL